MAEGFNLTADVRERTGKGAARALRRTGQIPAVIYGDNQPPLAIAIPAKETTLALYAGGFRTNVWSIDVGGRTIQALAKDIQREPVKDKLVHVDFLRVSARSRVTIDVAVAMSGEDVSPGVIAGGTPTLLEFTVSIESGATTIPDNIEISIADAELGDTVMSDKLILPDGVSLTNEEPFPVVSIVAPAAEPEPDEAEASGEAAGEADAAAEGEGDAPAEDGSAEES